MSRFDNVDSLKQYATDRQKIRLNGFGYINTRLTKLSLKLLRGFVKQINNQPLTPDLFELRVMLEKEIEFREFCLSLRSVFDIKIK